MKDLKFEVWVEIKEGYSFKKNEEPNWLISLHIQTCSIWEKDFFINNYPILTSIEEDGFNHERQEFKFNPDLFKKVNELLLNSNNENYISVPKNKAWDYYHYLSYQGFNFNVHPCSISDKFLRQIFTGTQEEIYNKAVEINDKWLKNYFDE